MTQPVWKKKETNNPPRNCQVRHNGCICVLPDAPSDGPKPGFLMSNILTTTSTTQGLQNDRPNNQTSEIYTRKIVLHIYKRINTHLNTAISQLITGAFFFGIRSCEYSTTPKWEDKCTRILQKGGIHFYRKRRELPHCSGILHLYEKVSLTFSTQKTGSKRPQ